MMILLSLLRVQLLLLFTSNYTYRSVLANSSIIKLKPLDLGDGVPALGRGYSVTTKTFFSSCFGDNATATEQASNLEYNFFDLTSSQSVKSSLLSKHLSRSFAFQKIKAAVRKQTKANVQIAELRSNGSDHAKFKYTAAVVLRIDRFYSSLRERTGDLLMKYKRLLHAEDYVNFFLTCGPTYVRSFKRAHEVTVIMTFDADDDHDAKEFADALRLHIFGNRGDTSSAVTEMEISSDGVIGETVVLPKSMYNNFDDSESRKSLSIEILGYGTGLQNFGSKTLVAPTLDEFNKVIKSAFDSMTNEKRPNIEPSQLGGIVYEMEVMPWSGNFEFLHHAGVEFGKISAPMPLSMIEDAKIGSVPTCFSALSKSDNFGKCCLPREMIKFTNVDESENVVELTKCEPKMFVSTLTMKINLDVNAEFIALLEFVNQEKANSLSTLGQCITNLRTLPEKFDYMFLHSNNKARYDQSIDMQYTVKELKAALDPAASLEILDMVSKENGEFLDMFYQPCLSSLYGMNDDSGKHADPKIIMAKPWYEMEKCSHPTCLESNKAWDRWEGNGCVPGILGRQHASDPIPINTDAHCAKIIDFESGEVSCKYDYVPYQNIVVQMDNCRQILPQGNDGRGGSEELSVSYLMEYFCMPKVAPNTEPASSSKMDEVDTAWEICKS